MSTNKEICYVYNCRSPLGRITMASDGAALTGLWLEGQKYFASTLTDHIEEKELPVFEQTRCWLTLYFEGKAPEFLPPLSLKGTPFQLGVWELLKGIPYGTTITYGELAHIIAQKNGLAHMSAQAVGGAVGRNPVSILVPCHRVVGKDGSMTGYAGGIDIKIRLLTLERTGNIAINEKNG